MAREIRQGTPEQDETDRLRAAIAESGPEPVILIWIKARPRITTMRPIAEKLIEKGFNTLVAYAADLDVTPEAMRFDARVRCFRVHMKNVRTLTGVTVCILAEKDTYIAPVDAKRVGIQHSLPDSNLRFDYATTLKLKPVVALETDYLAIPTKQPEASWNISHFQPHLDKRLPAPLLRPRCKNMTIIPFGYPKIDQMMAVDTRDDVLDTITYAPTQTVLNYSSVKQKGADIIAMLLKSFPEHRIAFRPYPGADVERTRAVYERFLDDPRFVMDDSPTGEALMRRSAVVITDRSSVAVSFGLGFARPVVTFEKGGKAKDIRGFAPIGLRVTSIGMLRQAVRQVLKNHHKIAERIKSKRGQFIYNPGSSAEYLAEIMPDIIAGGSRPEWLQVPRRPFPGWSRARNRAQMKSIEATIGKTSRFQHKLTEEILRPSFEMTPASRLRAAAGRVARRIPGLRHYLSRPRGPSKG